MNKTPSIDLAHEVIESIVSLTEQRDQHSLEHCLLMTLAEMLPLAEGWLLDIPATEGAGTEINVLYGNQDSVPRTLIENRCPRTEPGPLTPIDEGERSYLMTRLRDPEGDRLRILVLAQERWSESERQLVQGMLQVYQNFVGLLYDSEKDTLTGLYNRRKLETRLQEFDTARQQGRRSDDKTHGEYLAIMDLDRFKRINDTYGHLIGDEVLLTFANILRRTLRDDDLIFRYGGEEFIVLLQHTPHQSIEDVLERVRRNVAAHDFPLVGQVTVSIGYAALDGAVPSLETLERADRALYYAKDNGRDQVREFERLIREGRLEDIHRDGGVELF